MKIIGLFGLISSFVVFTQSRAFGQAAVLADDPATLAASATEAATAHPFVYSGQFLYELMRTADESIDTSYSAWYQITGSATYKRLGITTSARLGYTQEYTYASDDGSVGSVVNPSVTVSKSFLNGRDYNFAWFDSASISVSGLIGANRESERRSLLWTNGLTITGSKSLGRFFLRQSFGYSRSFFEYEIRDNGVVNSPSTLRSNSLVYYSLTDKLSLGGSFTYAYSVSYQDVGRVVTMAAASVDYVITNKISASLGVSSERSVLEPDGQSSRIRLYAPETAQYFADLIISL
jgi:hypothetical protein